jgi:plastocyanin
VHLPLQAGEPILSDGPRIVSAAPGAMPLVGQPPYAWWVSRNRRPPVTRVPRRTLAVSALAVPLVLAGCGGTTSSAGGSPSGSSSGSSGSSGSASGPVSGSASACGTARTITVKGSDVTPPPATVDVKAGCAVTLTVTADRTSVVHVHVVNIEKPIKAGAPTTIEFTPTEQGVYEVELHDPDLLLVKLAVR